MPAEAFTLTEGCVHGGREFGGPVAKSRVLQMLRDLARTAEHASAQHAAQVIGAEAPAELSVHSTQHGAAPGDLRLSMHSTQHSTQHAAALDAAQGSAASGALRPAAPRTECAVSAAHAVGDSVSFRGLSGADVVSAPDDTCMCASKTSSIHGRTRFAPRRVPCGCSCTLWLVRLCAVPRKRSAADAVDDDTPVSRHYSLLQPSAEVY